MRHVGFALLFVMLGLAFGVTSPVPARAMGDKTEAKAPMAFDEPPAAGTKATCPVGKETFTVTEKTERSEYKGKHYVFCCEGCKPKFDKNPETYVAKKKDSGGHDGH